MADAPQDSQEEFAKTREHEYQDPHYHDEDPEITDDELARRAGKSPTAKKKTMRKLPPQRRHYED
jgi:hypothetical protein